MISFRTMLGVLKYIANILNRKLMRKTTPHEPPDFSVSCGMIAPYRDSASSYTTCVSSSSSPILKKFEQPLYRSLFRITPVLSVLAVSGERLLATD